MAVQTVNVKLPRTMYRQLEKSATTMERIMSALVDKGWLDRRRNPKYKWDKTYQYRVNIIQIQRELMELGYSLEGYSLGEIKVEASKLQNEASTLQNEVSSLQNEGAIPEITTKSTLKTLEEEEEVITLADVMIFINEQIALRAITNQKTLTAIYEVATKCRAVGTNDREAMQNYCITVIEEKMAKFGQKQGTKAPRRDKAPTRTEIIPEHMKDGYEAPKQPQPIKKSDIDAMLEKLRN